MTLEAAFLLFGGKKEKCRSCSADARFEGTLMSYNKSCGSHKCGAIIFRKESDSPEYRKNISNAMKNVWTKRETSDEGAHIRDKIGSTKRANNANLSKEELSKKYGWMNRPDVTSEIKKQIWENSLGKYYASLTIDQRNELSLKQEAGRRRSIAKNGGTFLSENVVISEKVILNLIEFFNLETDHEQR